MPTYEYECKKCKKRFEVFQAIKDEPIKTCVTCGGEVRRVIAGGAGVIFKGSGFYVTDKSAKNPASPANKSTSSTDKKECASCPAATESGVCPAAKNSSCDSSSKAASKPPREKQKSA